MNDSRFDFSAFDYLADDDAAFCAASLRCTRSAAALTAFFDGQASTAEAMEARRHLGECARCRALWDDWSLMRELLRRETVPAPDVLFTQIDTAWKVAALRSSLPAKPVARHAVPPMPPLFETAPPDAAEYLGNRTSSRFAVRRSPSWRTALTATAPVLCLALIAYFAPPRLSAPTVSQRGAEPTRIMPNRVPAKQLSTQLLPRLASRLAEKGKRVVPHLAAKLPEVNQKPPLSEAVPIKTASSENEPIAAAIPADDARPALRSMPMISDNVEPPRAVFAAVAPAIAEKTDAFVTRFSAVAEPFKNRPQNSPKRKTPRPSLMRVAADARTNATKNLTPHPAISLTDAAQRVETSRSSGSLSTQRKPRLVLASTTDLAPRVTQPETHAAAVVVPEEIEEMKAPSMLDDWSGAVADYRAALDEDSAPHDSADL